MRLALVAADPELPEEVLPDEEVVPDPEDLIPENPALGAPFTAVLIIENKMTGDGRIWTPGSITWRDLPLPLMGLDVTSQMHETAKLVGLIEDIERVGAEIRATGKWLADDPEADRLRGLNEAGVLRWLSADLDGIEMELILPAEEEVEPNADGEVVVPMDFPTEVYTASRIMGATLLPFPAMQEAQLVTEPTKEPVEEIAATGWMTQETGGNPKLYVTHEPVPVTAAASALPAETEQHYIKPPLLPPLEWLANPLFKFLAPPTITNEGRTMGHLAAWHSCHIGVSGDCITPPHSSTDYAHFLTGELICAGGERVPVGALTIGTGHAELDAAPLAARRHYDDTGTVFADVNMGEDEFGIWYSGALRPDVTPLMIRQALAADLSGDWRRIGTNLELVATLAVNVPGFHKPRVRARLTSGLVAALVASLPVVNEGSSSCGCHSQTLANRIARTIGRTREDRRALANGIAERIGRDRASRRAALHQRVHP